MVGTTYAYDPAGTAYIIMWASRNHRYMVQHEPYMVQWEPLVHGPVGTAYIWSSKNTYIWSNKNHLDMVQ